FASSRTWIITPFPRPPVAGKAWDQECRLLVATSIAIKRRERSGGVHAQVEKLCDLGRSALADVARQVFEDFALHFLDLGAIAARHAREGVGGSGHSHLGQQILEVRDARASLSVHRHWQS